jgi:hypothetical protein
MESLKVLSLIEKDMMQAFEEHDNLDPNKLFEVFKKFLLFVLLESFNFTTESFLSQKIPAKIFQNLWKAFKNEMCKIKYMPDVVKQCESKIQERKHIVIEGNVF